MTPASFKGERHPADLIGNAVKVMQIDTGEKPADYVSVHEKSGTSSDASHCSPARERTSFTIETIPDEIAAMILETQVPEELEDRDE